MGITGEAVAVAAGATIGTGVIVPEDAIVCVGSGVGGGLEAAVGVSFFEHPAIRRKPAMPGRNFFEMAKGSSFGMAKGPRELLPDNYRPITSV